VQSFDLIVMSSGPAGEKDVAQSKYQAERIDLLPSIPLRGMMLGTVG
jgi:hypothetical protein